MPPVKATPSQLGMGGQRLRRPSRRRPAAGASSRGSSAGGVEQAHRLGRDQRRLLGRLGQDRVARRQRRGDLAGEDREREVPRADADEHAAAVQLQRIGFAGRAGQRARAGEIALGDGARSSGRSPPPRAPRPRRRAKVLPASRTRGRSDGRELASSASAMACAECGRVGARPKASTPAVPCWRRRRRRRSAPETSRACPMIWPSMGERIWSAPTSPAPSAVPLGQLRRR